MADEEEKPEGDAEAGGEEQEAKKGGVLPWILMTILAGGAGVAIPFLMPASAEETEEEPVEEPYELPEPEEMAFVPFEEVVVNLNEGSMTRYLRVAVALQVAKEKELDITTALEAKKALLKNWLINNISDKSLEDIRGRAGQNRLRREIRDEFNTVLFPDGYDQIYDILFDEYNIQ